MTDSVVRSKDAGRMTLDTSVLQAAPVNTESIVLYGARVVGKDTITDVLREDPRFKKISSHSPFRRARAGEEFASASGIESKSNSLSELQEDPLGYVAWFSVDDDVYAISPRAFEGVEVPVVHITGINGLNSLKKYQTLPNKLRVLITADPLEKEHLRGRVISRLQRKGDLPSEFMYMSATEDQHTLVERRLQQSLDSIRAFEEQESVNYHAVFENNAITRDDLRPYIYGRRPEQHDYDVQATDIARKIKALFEIYKEIHAQSPERDINPAHLHNRYITRCSVDLLTRKPSKLQKGRRIESTVISTTVPEYATARGLEVSKMEAIMQEMKIADVEQGSKETGKQGRFSVYLEPKRGPVPLQDIKDKCAGPDYFVLRVLGEHIAKTQGTWCRYNIQDGHLTGILFSLTDRIPAGQGPNMYHELWVGFK